MSAYRIAIDLTTQTIDKRAKYYRNLIVAVVFTSLASIGGALVSWSLLSLLGVFLLFPICGLFFFIDAKLLNQWRSQLFQHWVKKEIDFCSFCDTVNTISILPKNTLQGMLVTLPITGDIIAEQAISSSTREAMAASIAVNHANRSDAIALKVTGFAMVVCSLILALSLRIWQPLLGITVISIFPLLQEWTRRRRLRKSLKKVLLAQQKPDFNQEKYAQFVAELNKP